jgi:hypothetical protein
VGFLAGLRCWLREVLFNLGFALSANMSIHQTMSLALAPQGGAAHALTNGSSAFSVLS